MKKITQILIILCLVTVFTAPSVFAAEVPFEVIKTKVVAETVVPVGNGIEEIVINGKVYDSGAFSPDGTNPDLPTESPLEIYKGKIDSRVRVPIEGIRYKLEFWNVGAMGGEKGFIFKSSYDKAKLIIDYVTGQAYKMVATEKSFGGFRAQEKKGVGTPNIDSLEFELSFSGGPYGIFTLNAKDKKTYVVGKIIAGKSVQLNNFNINQHLIYEEKANLVIKSDGFEKWLEVLNDSSCDKDSGVRFSDYNGEVMYGSDPDKDAWNVAELDVVLCAGTHIETGDNSTAVLALADMTSFKMKPNSEIILSLLPESEDKLKLVIGKIWANVKEVAKHGTMTVEMTQAVAGIKGTTFIVEDAGDSSTLKVIEGHVEFTSKTTGKKEMVNGGEMIVATKEGLQEKKKFDVATENNSWGKIEKNNNNNSSNKSKNNEKDKTAKDSKSVLPWVILLILIIGIIGLSIFKKRNKKHFS